MSADFLVGLMCGLLIGSGLTLTVSAFINL